MKDGRIYLDSFWKAFAGDPSGCGGQHGAATIAAIRAFLSSR